MKQKHLYRIAVYHNALGMFRDTSILTFTQTPSDYTRCATISEQSPLCRKLERETGWNGFVAEAFLVEAADERTAVLKIMLREFARAAISTLQKLGGPGIGVEQWRPDEVAAALVPCTTGHWQWKIVGYCPLDFRFQVSLEEE